MNEETTGAAAPNRTTIILLGVIVVLLVAIAVIIFTGRDSGAPTNTGTATTGTGTTNTGTMPGATAETPFDPATATKVPEGQTPEDYVKTYFDAIVAGDFATAWAMLPADKKAAQDEASFSEQLAGYGISTYVIDETAEEGDGATVLATASAPGGQFQYLWTFVKTDSGWLVKSRTLPGMGQ